MIQSVRRATAILLELGSGQRRLGVTELADRLGLAKATVYGLLRALEADEMVQRDVESGKYRLGPVLLQLGNASWRVTNCGRVRCCGRTPSPIGPNRRCASDLDGLEHPDRASRVPARHIRTDLGGGSNEIGTRAPSGR